MAKEVNLFKISRRERSKPFSVYLYVLNQIKEGSRPSKIAEKLNFSKQNLQKYLNKLKKGGFLIKKGYGVWEVQKEVNLFSLGTRPKTNLHALQINFPILSGKIEGSDWEIKEKLNNWLPKYKNLSILGGLTLKNNNNKSLTIFAHARDILTLQEIDNLAFKIRAYAFEYFKAKYEVILDVMNAEVKNMNIATEDKEAEGMQRKGEKFELDLQKKAEKIFEQDKIEAKAWLDGSPFNFSAETNDKEWKRAYLNMPFYITGLTNSMPALEEYNKNLKLHIKVQEGQLKVQEEQIKTLKKIQEGLDKK